MITYTTTRLIEVQGSPGRIVTFKLHNVILDVLNSIKERKRRSRNWKVSHYEGNSGLDDYTNHT